MYRIYMRMVGLIIGIYVEGSCTYVLDHNVQICIYLKKTRRKTQQLAWVYRGDTLLMLRSTYVLAP